MGFLPRIRRILRVPRPKLSRHTAREVEDELRFHIESRARDLVAREGLSRAEAETRARREFGDMETTLRRLRRDTRRAERRLRAAESLERAWGDVRLAGRVLRRARGFSIVTIATLALGLGSTLALYTVLDSVVLEPLAYPASDRLLDIYSAVPGLGFDRWEVTEAGYVHFRRESRTLAAVGAYRVGAGTLEGDRGAERIDVAVATPDLLVALGATPAIGRLLAAADAQRGASRVALLSHEEWSSRYGSRPDIVGRSLRVQGVEWQVVGVLAAGFDLPESHADLWVPLAIDEADPDADSHSLHVIGRRRDGAALPVVQDELDRLTDRLPSLHPDQYSAAWMRRAGFRTVAQSLHHRVVGDDARRAIWILMGAAGLILVIAIANVVNLSLVRNLDRAREIRVRTALGGGTARLLRLLGAEAVVLVGVAGVASVGLARGALVAVRAIAPRGLPRLGALAMDGSALAAATASMILVTLILTLLPLSAVGRGGGPGGLVGGSGRATAGRGLGRLRAGLVTGQVALALLLLNSSGLLARSFERLVRVDPGFVPDGVLAVDVSLPARDYPDQASVHAFYRDVLATIRAHPGVAAAGAVTSLPLESGLGCYELHVESRRLAEDESPPCVDVHVATPGYFETLRIPLSEGRWFRAADNEQATGALVVTRTLASQLWPDRGALGEGANIEGERPPWFRVVGVTGDLRSDGLERPPTAAVFLPLVSPEGARRFLGHRAGMTLVARAASGDPRVLLAGIRRAVADRDPSVAVANPRRVRDVVAATRARTTLAAALLATAALIALVLGVVGLHGVVSYSVARRTREIGIRMALGADGGCVRRTVLAGSGRLVAGGVAMGLLAAWATGGLLRGLLYGVAPHDPALLAAVAALLVAVAMIASFVPANRAAHVDPSRALRHH